MRNKFCLVFVVVSILTSTVVTESAPIRAGSATYEYTNTFTTRLFPGTPFNPGTEAVDIPVFAEGVFTQVWEAQVGNSIADELTNIHQVGALPGDPPIPFEIIGGIERTPNLGPFVGTIFDIVQDSSDPGFDTGEPSSLTTASRVVSGPFAQILADGTYLYSYDDYVFEADIAGLPFPVGSQFVGAADSEVAIRVRLGAEIDPVNDPVVGLVLGGGLIEITNIVPEPSSWVLCMMAGLAVFRRRHRATR
ncbi:MAG: PEP-CTERM sorting domain-containing protein [Planctomycetales bacterium]|nr:PEP-CTERM sorting domain-containing protein [Planctomycetales bacterium]